MFKILFRLALLAGIGYGAYRGYMYFQMMPARQQQVATTRVRKGDVTVKTFSRGELRAVRSVTLTAPNLFGTVQVTRLASLGSLAKEKNLVVEFDDSELLSRVEEKQLELDQIDEQIKKSRADLSIRNNQDQVELLRTRYSVRRAELEVKRNELLSEIDRKKNLLNLEESKRRLKQLESDIKSRLEQAEAELAVLQERRNKSVLELNREKQRLMQVKLLSPITGLVAVRQNRASGFFVPGMTIPDIRDGDQVQPGMPVADILDLSELEVISRVGELDRANLREGQDVVMHLDAIPDNSLTGRIKSMSGTATASIFSNDPAKKFDVIFSIDMKQLLSALGASQQQIEKILATAEANRKKPVAANPFAMGGGAAAMAGGGPGAMMGAGGPGGMPGAPGVGGQEGAPIGPRISFGPGGQGGQAGQGGARGAGGAMAGMSPEQMAKVREIMRSAAGGKSPAEMNDEERTAFQKKMQDELKKAGINMPAGFGGGGGRRTAGAAGGDQQAAAGGTGAPGAEGGRRRGGAGRGGPETAMAAMGGGFGAIRFTQKDLDAAVLPPPPEEDAQLDVLLRPGMLADVEIIVEKIPDAVHVPTQAIFDRDNKPVVYLKVGQRFEERPVQIARRTESTVVIASGVKPGDTVAMADPLAKPGDKKKKSDSKGGAMSALPVGGAK